MKRYRKTHRSRGWTKQESAYVWERDGGHCIYCGAYGNQIDHVVPASKGGPTIRANAVLSCRYCNMRKSNQFPLDMLIQAFYHLLMKDEDIGWLDSLWLQQQDTPNQHTRRRRVNEDMVEYAVSTPDDLGHIAALWHMGNIIAAAKEIVDLYRCTNGQIPDSRGVA